MSFFICFNKKKKKNETGTLKENYKELGELPVCHLYKKFAIFFILKKLSSKNSVFNKRETYEYDLKSKLLKKKFRPEIY